MIRLVTYRNFPLRDLQMEEDYLRRRSVCDLIVVEEVDDVRPSWPPGDARRRRRRGRNWLSRLARAVDDLAKTPAPRQSRDGPSARLVAANGPAGGSRLRQKRVAR